MKSTLLSSKKALDKKLSESDLLSPIAREGKILSDRSIALYHSGKRAEARSLLLNAGKKISILKVALRKNPSIYYSSFPVQLAFQEYSEALIFFSVSEKGRFPELEGIPPEAVLLGLADSIGEINRAYLEARISGNEKRTVMLADCARQVGEFFSEFDYPDFVVPSFRHKKDFVRGILNSILSAEARDAPRNPREKERKRNEKKD